MLSANSAAPSPSCYSNDVDGNAIGGTTTTSTPVVRDASRPAGDKTSSLSALSQAPYTIPHPRPRQASSTLVEDTETSPVSERNLLPIENLTEDESLVPGVAPETTPDLPVYGRDSDDQLGDHMQTEGNHQIDNSICQEQEDPQHSSSGETRHEIVSYDGTDKSLKQAIQESYVTYGLETCLQFRYGSGPFHRCILELSTNWKGRSILSATSWKSLNGVLQQIMSLLPDIGKPKQMQKEKGLMQRILHGTRQKSEERSLKAVAMALHRERNHAKDESRVANFEFYSTLIVMRYLNESEVRLVEGC